MKDRSCFSHGELVFISVLVGLCWVEERGEVDLHGAEGVNGLWVRRVEGVE